MADNIMHEIELSNILYGASIVIHAKTEELPSVLEFALHYGLEIRIGVGTDAE